MPVMILDKGSKVEERRSIILGNCEYFEEKSGDNNVYTHKDSCAYCLKEHKILIDKK